MTVQHYRMQLVEEFRSQASPGQAVFRGNDIDLIGFIWKFDPIDNVVDVVLFEPEEMELGAHQTFVASHFTDPEIVFGGILAEATDGVKAWWREAITEQHKTEA